jgi:PAS domain S-box-containing protein
VIRAVFVVVFATGDRRATHETGQRPGSAVTADLSDAASFDGPEGAAGFVASIVDSTACALVGTDEHGVVVLWNEGARRLYGYAPAEAVGLPATVLHTCEDVEAGLPQTIAGAAARDGEWSGTVERVRKDASRFTARLVATARRDADGQLTGLLLVSRDVTHELRLTAELERANRVQERFLASIGHDLRSPLNAILGFTGMLLMQMPGPINDEQRMQLSTVQASGRQLLMLIDDLLDLGRVEAGSFDFQPEVVSCQELLADVAAGLRPLAEEKGLVLELAGPDEPLTIRTDRRSLRQILRNLADNAVRFTDEGAVGLEVGRHHSGAGTVTRFSITDSGCGIDDAGQRRLRDALDQIGGPGSRPYAGTGLGLYVCQTLARSLGASVAFESSAGHGSTFTLELGEQVRAPSAEPQRVALGPGAP